MTPTFRYQRHGNLVLVVQSAQAPSAADWAGYLDLYRRGWHRYHECRILVLSAGGSPSNVQQRQVTELVPGLAVRVAVVALADSVGPVVRRLLIINDAMRMFPPDGVEDAMAFLDVPEAERPLVRDTLATLRAEVGV